MTEMEMTRVLHSVGPNETSQHATVKALIRGAELSLNEKREVVSSLGGVMCDCPIPTPIAPEGMCPDCGVEGPFRQAAIERWEKQKASEGGLADKYPPVNWEDVFKSQPIEVEWLKEDFLVAGTLSTLYSKPGIGKSLISLEIALEVIKTGHLVMYVDDENRICDVVERLQAFRRSPAELDRLVYFSFAGLPALDTPAGGIHLQSLVEQYQPHLVIMDTISRMVSGEENQADTWNQLYRCSLVGLKALGVAVLRLDHSGKDDSRGMRGSSSKESDVDYVWRLARDGENSFSLECQKSRTGHVPFGQIITLERKFEPLRHVWDVKVEIPLAHYSGIITQMDNYGIPTSYGRERVRTILKQHNVNGLRNDQLQAAIIERRNRERRVSVPVPGTSGNQGTSINTETGEVECPF